MNTQPNVPQADKPFNSYTRVQLDNMMQSAMQQLLGFRRDPKPIEVPGLPRLFVFNVSDKEYTWKQPGFDMYVIPACGPDEECSKPIYALGHEDQPGIPGLVTYEFLEIDKTKWAQHLGEEVAMEIMGLGAGKQDQQNLENFGLFRSWSNPPKTAEIAAAKGRFMATLEQLVKEGNFIHSQGEKKGVQGQLIGSEHIWAARLLGQQEPWARGARQMVLCPHCQYDMPANASVHYGPGGCGGVIDWDAAIECGLKKESDRPRKSAAKDKTGAGEIE